MEKPAGPPPKGEAAAPGPSTHVPTPDMLPPGHFFAPLLRAEEDTMTSPASTYQPGPPSSTPSETMLLPPPPAKPRRRFEPRRKHLAIALVLLLLLPLVVFAICDYRLNRQDVWPTAKSRPAATPGADWLIVGSDSRDGLSTAQKKQLATGSAPGQRTDTMMLLHIPADTSGSGGGPTLVSLPRDSYVSIPGHGQNKLNAAYAFGGPKLLVQTVEGLTGIRIDHYVEIGFGGLYNLVNDVGGVPMCLNRSAKDPKAALNVKAGCQTLNGQEALGYSRSRASARGDLDRVDHQRTLITALLHKATSPMTLLNPLHSFKLVADGPGAVAAADGDHLTDLARLAWAARSLNEDGTTTTVPIGRVYRVNGVGDVLGWDTARARALFTALRQDKPVPRTSLAT
jgi:LCP family protein required for cell wall assembly